MSGLENPTHHWLQISAWTAVSTRSANWNCFPDPDRQRPTGRSEPVSVGHGLPVEYLPRSAYFATLPAEAHVQGLIALPAGQRGELSQVFITEPGQQCQRANCMVSFAFWTLSGTPTAVSEAAKTLNQKLEELSLTEDCLWSPILFNACTRVISAAEEMSALFQAYPKHFKIPWNWQSSVICACRIFTTAYYCTELPAETGSFRARVGLWLQARYATITPEIQDCLNAELKELTLQKQTKWYLFLADLCSWLKSQDLVYSTLIGNQGLWLVMRLDYGFRPHCLLNKFSASDFRVCTEIYNWFVPWGNWACPAVPKGILGRRLCCSHHSLYTI